MADNISPDDRTTETAPQNEVSASVLNDSQKKEFAKVNDLLVSRGLPPQSEADYLNAIHFNTATAALQQTDRRDSSASKKIVIPTERADESKKKEVEKFNGQIGEIYTLLEQELEQLLSDQALENNPSRQFDILQHARMLTLLDTEFDIIMDKLAKKEEIGFAEVASKDPAQAKVYETGIRDTILSRTDLGSVLHKLDTMLSVQPSQPSVDSINRRVTVNKLRLKILSSHPELAA